VDRNEYAERFYTQSARLQSGGDLGDFSGPVLSLMRNNSFLTAALTASCVTVHDYHEKAANLVREAAFA